MRLFSYARIAGEKDHTPARKSGGTRKMNVTGDDAAARDRRDRGMMLTRTRAMCRRTMPSLRTPLKRSLHA